LDRRIIEKRPPGGNWTPELQLTDKEFRQISTGCSGGQRGVLASLAVAESAHGESVVVSLGAEGVLVSDGQGTWQKRAVLDAPPPKPGRAQKPALIAALLFGPVLAGVIGLLGRKRWPSIWLGMAVAAGGWAFTLAGAGATLVLLEGAPLSAAAVSLVVALGCSATAVGAVAIARMPGSTKDPAGATPVRRDS
jgi:hypothetical protein